MNCVGIDVSKGKSMIAVMRPFGEVVVSCCINRSYSRKRSSSIKYMAWLLS